MSIHQLDLPPQSGQDYPMKTTLLALIRSLGRLWCQLQGAQTHPSAIIHGFPRICLRPSGRIILDADVTINASSWSNPLNDGRRTVIHAGPGATIHLHPRSGISSSRLIAFSGISIGEGTLIGAGCLICDSDMHEVPLGSKNPVATAPIHIGNHVFLGANCIVLKGVTIGDGVVVGANSLVANNIPSGVLAVGNPARVARSQH